jgi:hypothetical protein
MSVFFYVFCEDCGSEVRSCRICNKARANILSDVCQSCNEMFCCGYAEQHYHEDPSVKALYLCEDCQEARNQASAQIWSYWYWPADRDLPLSPTNVYRIPRFRAVSEGPTDPVARADEALAAYNEELNFSGSQEEALQIYVSFYNRGSVDPKKERQMAVREGFVSLKEILAGRHVTGDQFFKALKHPEEESEEPSIGNNPKTMTKDQLQRAIDEATEDIKRVIQRNRGQKMGWDDSILLMHIKEWASFVIAELKSR